LATQLHICESLVLTIALLNELIQVAGMRENGPDIWDLGIIGQQSGKITLNYVSKNWVQEGENPPLGLILCADKDEAGAQYVTWWSSESDHGC